MLDLMPYQKLMAAFRAHHINTDWEWRAADQHKKGLVVVALNGRIGIVICGDRWSDKREVYVLFEDHKHWIPESAKVRELHYLNKGVRSIYWPSKPFIGRIRRRR